MTKEQKIVQISKEYRKYRESCGVVDPVELDEIEDAYYDGYICAENAMIEKACEWLYEYCRYGCCEYIEKNDFIEDFRKAME